MEGPLERFIAAALALGFVGFLIFGIVEFVGDASASPDERFLELVHSETDTGSVTDKQLVDAGTSICDDLSDGATIDTIVDGFRGAGLPPDFAGTLTANSIRVYCPEHEGLID